MTNEEQIAAALTRIAIVMEKRLEKDYPTRGNPRDAVVTRIPTDEDRIRGNVQGPETTFEQIGTFEQKFVEAERQSGSQGGSTEKAGRQSRVTRVKPTD